MRNHIKQLLPILILAVIVIGVPLYFAHAQEAVTNFLGYRFFTSLIQSFIGNLANVAMGAMGFLVAIAGYLLNFSINLTLHIKDFVDSTPAIFTTWKALRDISGIALIFFLIYAAFQLILGVQSPKWGDLIKNIVMAGIMINFSFFFAGLGIDASNIVSVQLYNAIAPAQSLNPQAASMTINTGTFNFLDGGLSDVFMSSLKIQSIHDTEFVTPNGDTGNSQQVGGISGMMIVTLQGLMGVLIEFGAAMSFFAAALAFIVRFVVLIVLLAFSPIWFLSFLPEVGSYTKKWVSTYKSMLIFMPVYLLLMYLALSVLTTSPLFGQAPPKAGQPVTMIESALAQTQAAAATNGAWYSNLLVLAANGAIVILLINMPLAAAASIAGTQIPFLKGAAKKFDMFNPWKKMGTSVGSYAGSATLGRAAFAAKNSTTMAKLSGSLPGVGSLVDKQLGKVSNAGFGGEKKKSGYEDRLKAKTKAQEAMHKQIGSLDRSTFKTQEAYDAALKTRKDVQANYRKNLPWKNGVFGFVMDNRANLQSAQSLNDDANLKDNQERIKQIKTEREAITLETVRVDKSQIEEKRREIAAKLKSLVPNEATRITLTQTEKDEIEQLEKQDKELREKQKGPDIIEREKDLAELTNEQIYKLDQLRREERTRDAAIERATGKKKRQEVSELAKAVSEVQKSDGGGEDKPEKKEEPKEEAGEK